MAHHVNPARGMRDFLPADKAKREQAFRIIRQNYSRHGFAEIETPVVEEYSRLHSGLGADNEKLSFNIMRRGLTEEQLQKAVETGDPEQLADLGLRFDLTVPLARYYASNHAKLPRTFRALQMGPVWRAERPQKGRYRQFVQCDIDIIGEPGLIAEIELISATLSTLERLGVPGCSVAINDRRILNAMLTGFGFVEAERERVLVTIDKMDKIASDGVIRELEEWGATPTAIENFRTFLMRPQTLEYNPFGERQIRKMLPEGIPDEYIADLVTTGEGVAASLGFADIPLTFQPFLVRGMGYYTGQIFEVVHPDFDYSLGGGGRYDGMIGRFLGRDTPAVGFSIGFERILDLIQLDDDSEAGKTALVYDAAVPLPVIFQIKNELMLTGKQVRLVKRPKKLVNVLNELTAEGFTQFATLNAEQRTIADLELKPLS